MTAWSVLQARLDAAELRAFGETVTHLPSAGVPYDLTLIVDEPNLKSSEAPSSALRLRGPAAAFTLPPKSGDRVLVRSRHYGVYRIEAGSADTAMVLFLRAC